MHGEIIRAAADAAVLYRITGKRTFFDYARKMLLWYADNYENFEVHGQHAGKGRIHSQSLDEATHLVLLAQAYWDICPDLAAADRATIVEKFLLPDAKFIHGQTRVIHNIHSWHNAAVGLVGLAIGDAELTKAAIDGPCGLKQQIQKGVKEDGFWYEGSISYHFYTVSSLQPLYLAAKVQGYALEGTEKFRLMYTGPVDFTFDNGEFPANNDGWPGQNIRNLGSYYEVAAGLWNDPQAVDLLRIIYGRGGRSGENALLFGPGELSGGGVASSRSDLFTDSGVAILRNDAVNAYLKFGPYGGGHEHNDRLNLILFARGKVVIPDLGTSGYGSRLTANGFARRRPITCWSSTASGRRTAAGILFHTRRMRSRRALKMLTRAWTFDGALLCARTALKMLSRRSRRRCINMTCSTMCVEHSRRAASRLSLPSRSRSRTDTIC